MFIRQAGALAGFISLLATSSLSHVVAADAADQQKSAGGAESLGPVVGIDLGTTYSVVAIYKNGRVDVIANKLGHRITPSYVSFDADTKEHQVGAGAKNNLVVNPTQTVFGVKRFIGREYNEPAVLKDIKLFPFSVIEKSNKPYIKVTTDKQEKTFAPEEISAMVLREMKATAEAYLGVEVKNAVITVPAYFTDAQRQATKDAGRISGLNVLRIINEPTAAAIAYGLDKMDKGSKDEAKEKNILVYDLGGGTFDVSLLTIDEGVFEVVATSGDTHLGGEDFDQHVMQYFIKELKAETGVDVKNNKKAVQIIRREAEKAKRTLSTQLSVTVEFENLAPGVDKWSKVLTRAKFEDLNNDLFMSTLNPIKKVLSDAKMQKVDVDEIILVGGSTRIPKIQAIIKDFFKKEPNRGINPDEAVAYGAAVQGGILSGDTDKTDLVLLDVTPLTLGIETVGGVMSPIVKRNTVIPTKKTQVFSTHNDNQTQVQIRVFEGERPMTTNNNLLGSFSLSGIPPAPRGVPQIQVTFSIDANGILSVTAEVVGVGKKKEITITNENRLSADQIEKMVQDAKDYEEQDKVDREKITSRINLDSYVHSLKQLITESGAKLDEEDKTKIEEAAKDGEGWLAQHSDADAEDYKEKQKELEATCSPILKKLYGQAGMGAGRPAADDDEEGDDHDEL